MTSYRFFKMTAIDWLIELGLTSHQTHYRSYRGRVFTGQMTQPTVSKHWRKRTAKESEMYFRVRFRFTDGICLRTWKCICMPNFDEISQSAAEIKLIPVLENGRPPYWNFISGFGFHLCIVIGIPFCICLPNFVVICWLSAELWRHIHFLKMAACSHIGFDVGNVRRPSKCNCRYQLGPQIWSWSDL